MPHDLRVRVLGPVRLVGHDGRDVNLRGHAAALLATLALRPGRVWPADHLERRLWPAGPPPTARTALQGHVSRLRRSLTEVDGVGLDTVGGGYALRAERDAVDSCRFDDLVGRAGEAATSGRATAAVALLTEALGLWSGDALDGARAGELGADAEALDEARRDAEEQLAAALVEAGSLPTALTLAGRLVNDDPLRERRWVHLVTALARSGRQADALRACRQATAIIADRTGLEPGAELRGLEMAILTQDPALADGRWAPAPGSAPVPLVATIGREADRERLAARLRDARMVTVVGPGGIGKSTLAVEVAAAEAARYTEGAVMVDLTDSTPDDVARAITDALGPAGPAPPGHGTTQPDDPFARAVEALERREVLVVLDNCADVMPAAATAAIRLLGAGPGVRVMATSPASLGVAGETVIELRPLDVARSSVDVTAIRASAAGDLLARRLSDQGRPVTGDDDWRAVGAIARTLDGMPLALEIAAAAARYEPLDQLARRLEGDSSSMLDADLHRPGRRRSLRAALDATTGRLDPQVRRVFAALGALPASFDAGLAAAVAATDEATARASLRALTDAALVVADQEDRTRARLLGPVRAYARGLLERPDHEAALDRLVGWCRATAADLAITAKGPGQGEAIERFVVELPTLRAGLRHLLDTDRVADAAVLFEDMVVCWGDSPAGPEAPAWADELLRHADRLAPGPRAHLCLAAVRCRFAFDAIADHLPLAERALADAEAAGERVIAAGARISVAIGLGWRAVDLDRAARLLAEARHMLDDLGEAHWAAVAREFQGLLALRRLDVAAGLALLTEALGEHRRVGAPGDIAHALTFIGFARRLLDDPVAARRAFDEARRLIGATRVSTWLRATAGSGYAALAAGDVDGAAQAFRAGHAAAVEVGDRRMASTFLMGLAAVARHQGDEERSVALLLAAGRQGLDGGDPSDAVSAAVAIARVLSDHGHDDDAALLLGASGSLPSSASVRVHFGLAEDPGPVRRALEDRMGPEAFAALAADGALVGLPAALDRAAERLVDTSPVLVGEGDLRLAG